MKMNLNQAYKAYRVLGPTFSKTSGSCSLGKANVTITSKLVICIKHTHTQRN